jgi:hypothetical protein
MTVRDIKVKFGFDVDTQKLSKVEQSLDGIKRRLSFLAGAELFRGIYELGEKFGRVGEEIAIASEQAGLSVENFQKLAFAAKQNGVSQEDLSRSLTILSRNLYNARIGSAEAQRAFSLAGFTPQQVAGFKTSQDALLALSDAMRKEQDPIKRAALGRELLGRGSAQMSVFLSRGSKALREQAQEAQKFGLILSGPQVKALETVQHSFQKLFAVMEAFGAMVASKIAPVLSRMIDDLLNIFGENKGTIDKNIDNFINKLAYGLGFVVGIIQGVTKHIREFLDSFDEEGSALSILYEGGKLVLGAIAIGKAFGIVESTVLAITGLLSPLNAALASAVLLYNEYNAAKDSKSASDFYHKSGKLAQISPAVVITELVWKGLEKLRGDSSAAVTVNNTFNITGSEQNDLVQQVIQKIDESKEAMLRGAARGAAYGAMRY